MSLSALLEPDRRWMKVALQEAERAFDQNEVPIGAVIVHKGQIVGTGPQYGRATQRSHCSR